LGYASDLDLVFLYDVDTADPEAEARPERYARLAQRLITWLTANTAAGQLYDTDLRLRPDGASGLLVSSLAAFRKYQRENAWTWEHQALTRARFVAGDPQLGAAFEAEREAILRMPRGPGPLAADVAEMRRKMAAGHPNRTVLFDLKHDPGGMVDVEFAVQYLVLAHAHQHPELTRNAATSRCWHECRFGPPAARSRTKSRTPIAATAACSTKSDHWCATRPRGIRGAGHAPLGGCGTLEAHLRYGLDILGSGSDRDSRGNRLKLRFAKAQEPGSERNVDGRPRRMDLV
jgi:hypothetical protein